VLCIFPSYFLDSLSLSWLLLIYMTIEIITITMLKENRSSTSILPKCIVICSILFTRILVLFFIHLVLLLLLFFLWNLIGVCAYFQLCLARYAIIISYNINSIKLVHKRTTFNQIMVWVFWIFFREILRLLYDIDTLFSQPYIIEIYSMLCLTVPLNWGLMEKK
jgi:hypothetical protein